MRRVLFLALSAAAAGVLAQQPPPKLEPLPEAPPPPVVREGADDANVRIAPQKGDKIEEVRDGGRIVMIKVTPANGAPYYLVDPLGNGNWTLRDSLDPGVRVPMWTIKTFD
ncbi:MAG TPA: DUF2782 domain-containing protein [Burkholderiales bacterium]|nr:DUF2782 domain-containing protein [Burkholderiales bacterium]